MSSKSATRRASAASEALQHPCLCAGLLTDRASETPPTDERIGRDEPDVAQTASSVAPDRINSPTTSYPCRLSSTAAAELSTPPLIAKTTRWVIVVRLQIAHRARLVWGRVPVVPDLPILGKLVAVGCDGQIVGVAQAH